MTSSSESELIPHQATNPAAKLVAINTLAEKLCEVDPDRAILLAAEAFELAVMLDDREGMVIALLNRAWAEYSKADYSSSFISVQEGLRIASVEHFDQQRFDALTILGNNHKVIGNLADALQCFTEALAISKRLDNPRRVATALSNIGQQYTSTGSFTEALEHYLEALAIMRAANAKPIVLTNVLLNVTETLNSLQRADEAIRYATECLHLAQTEGYVSGEALALLNLANAHDYLRHTASAQAYYQQALDRIQQANAPIYEAEIHKDQALFLVKQGNIAAALDHLHSARIILEGLDTKPEIFEIHHHLAQLYQRLGDYALAYDHLEQFQKIKEQVFNEQADNRQKTLQALYEVEKARLAAETQYHQNLALQDEIQQSEQIIAELDAYADNVAHDLRNPIGVIIGFGGLMEMNLEDTLDEENLGYLKNLLAAADKMNEIVEALLTLARARKEAILPQLVDMEAVLQEALARVQPLAAKHHARIKVAGEMPPAMGNASWLEEAFVNYINNAIKYGGSPPIIHIGATPEPNGFVRYWVRDNGNGMDQDAQQRLFQKFERLGQQKIDGHGIGLTIVKNIVEKLGGRVGVSSSGVTGEGSTFSFTLPIPTLE